MLLEAGLITEEQLGEALKYQAQEKERLGTTLVKHNYITEKQLIDTLRIQLGIEYIDLSKVDITPEMSRYVPKNLAKKMNVVPVRVSRDQLFLAMADPLNFMAIDTEMRALPAPWRISGRRRRRPGRLSLRGSRRSRKIKRR